MQHAFTYKSAQEQDRKKAYRWQSVAANLHGYSTYNTHPKRLDNPTQPHRLLHSTSIKPTPLSYLPLAPSQTYLLTRPRPCNPRPNHTRQLLPPNPHQQPNPPPTKPNQRNRHPGKQPKWHTNIFLLTCRAAPEYSLDLALGVGGGGFTAAAGEAVD